MWASPPSDLVLHDGAVHVWRVSLDASRTTTQQFRELLATDEVERADRFHFDHDRTRFTVARGMLRLILGRYLHIDPAAIRFWHNRWCKPALAPTHHTMPLYFNVSHSAHLALIAVAGAREVGVDIEQVRTDIPCIQIAQSTFSSTETAALRQLPASLQPIGFFNCWTRKEAYIKARGLGMSLPLDQFDVSLTPGEPAALLRTAGEPNEVHSWSIQELVPGPNFVGAVAAEGQHWQVACWQFEQ